MGTTDATHDHGDARSRASDTPIVDGLISRVMAQHPGLNSVSRANYYEAVHQELAPLARSLEREVRMLRRAAPADPAPLVGGDLPGGKS